MSSSKVSTASIVTSKTLEVFPQRRMRIWLQYFRSHDMAIMTFYIRFSCIGYRLSEKTLIESKMGAKWDNLNTISHSMYVGVYIDIFDSKVTHIHTYILFLLLNNL